VEKSAKAGGEISLLCNHLCLNLIPEVTSDLKEKYCISDKALHTMFDQLCLPLVKQNTSCRKCTTIMNRLAWFQLLTIPVLVKWM